MLQNIRDWTQGWIASTIIIIIVITFGIWGIQSYLRSGGRAGNIAAKVNGVEITKIQFKMPMIASGRHI